jgi:hypothetical protein
MKIVKNEGARDKNNPLRSLTFILFLSCFIFPSLTFAEKSESEQNQDLFLALTEFANLFSENKNTKELHRRMGKVEARRTTYFLEGVRHNSAINAYVVGKIVSENASGTLKRIILEPPNREVVALSKQYLESVGREKFLDIRPLVMCHELAHNVYFPNFLSFPIGLEKKEFGFRMLSEESYTVGAINPSYYHTYDEGVSDWQATLACLPFYLKENPENEEFLQKHSEIIRPFTVDLCKRRYDSENDINICIRSITLAHEFALQLDIYDQWIAVRRKRKQFEVDFNNLPQLEKGPLASPTRRRLGTHPPAQCRLEAMIRGALKLRPPKCLGEDFYIYNMIVTSEGSSAYEEIDRDDPRGHFKFIEDIKKLNDAEIERESRFIYQTTSE